MVRSRTTGMWWGPAVEAPNPAALGPFHAQLLEWPVVHEEPGTTVLAALPGPSFLVFEQATDYVPPVWPPVEGRQRPMVHLDFQVGDFEAAVADAVARGARLADVQPQEHVRVLLDPAGHPFCLVLETA